MPRKNKPERAIFDRAVDVNSAWITKLGGIASAEAVINVVYPYVLKKVLADGCPIDYAADIAKSSLLDDQNDEQMTKILCINNFSYSGRQVYRFDDTLAELLAGQTRDDLKMSTAALDKLPVDSFYILRRSAKRPHSEGFFFSRADDTLYIADILDGGSDDVTFAVRLADDALISDVLEEDYVSEYGGEDLKLAEPHIKRLAEEIAEYMQFVIYLCAINAEIVPVTSRSVIKRQAGQRAPATARTRSERADVGYKIGAAIRKAKDSTVVYVGEHSKGSKKAPHIRRSHYHHYWIGGGDDRELIVKWLDPIFVNGRERDSSTVHDVK